jgi:hypothetical protein
MCSCASPECGQSHIKAASKSSESVAKQNIKGRIYC